MHIHNESDSTACRGREGKHMCTGPPYSGYRVGPEELGTCHSSVDNCESGGNSPRRISELGNDSITIRLGQDPGDSSGIRQRIGPDHLNGGALCRVSSERSHWRRRWSGFRRISTGSDRADTKHENGRGGRGSHRAVVEGVSRVLRCEDAFRMGWNGRSLRINRSCGHAMQPPSSALLVSPGRISAGVQRFSIPCHAA